MSIVECGLKPKSERKPAKYPKSAIFGIVLIRVANTQAVPPSMLHNPLPITR